jgi:AraC family transcriptional regulator of adaptative response / DNA-3-methyladenine glycosylase II
MVVAPRYTQGMKFDREVCYRALGARDARFDGVFYVGVRSTGVYCRPVCPARTPREDRCDFFMTAVEAEQAGFRACLRCRPELAPGAAQIDALPRLARAALSRIEAGYLNDHGVDDLAQSLGVSARHLRRTFESEVGVSPQEAAQSHRIALAKRLVVDTSLPLTQIAYASGFGSLRRFHEAFRARVGRAPSALRRAKAGPEATSCITLRLDYRPPFDLAGLFGFLKARAIPGVELVEGQEYRRTYQLGASSGWLQVAPDPKRHALRASVSLSLTRQLLPIVAGVRELFDLDARPDRVAAQLASDPRLAPLVAARPGLRLPGAVCRFETAVRAVVGQQVSVSAATTLCARLARRFGTEVATPWPAVDRLFPEPAQLAAASESEIAAIGMPGSRARTLLALARAVESGFVDLSGGPDPEQVLERLQELPGIGPWTSQYIGMRVLHWPDAFPAGDLGVRKALGVSTNVRAEKIAESWRPFRAYAVMHLWMAHAPALIPKRTIGRQSSSEVGVESAAR